MMARNLLFILVVSFVLPIFAEGAVFYNLDDESLADSAELAILGKVDFIKSEESFDGSIHTLVSIEVIEVLKGSYGGTHLVAKRLGGEVGGKGLAVFGTPNFTLGEEVALLLRQGDEYFEVVGMSLGKFNVSPGKGKGKVLTRDTREVMVIEEGRQKSSEPVGEMTLGSFRNLVGKSKPVKKPGTSVQLEHFATIYEDSLPYTFNASQSRHFPADIPVGLTVNTSSNPLGDATAAYDAVVAGFAGWNNVLASPLLEVTGTTTSTAKRDNVRFGDPDGEIADHSASSCAGTAARGGVYYNSGESMVASGTTFIKAYDPFIIVNNGYDTAQCPQLTVNANLTNILMHEAGHAIGIGHSDDTTARMYPGQSITGEYEQLGVDDITAVRYIYPELGIGVGSIPTLSEWGAIILILSMLGVFVLHERKREWIDGS